LELVEKIRTAMPDISLSTDIIVGYPEETEEDFLETMDVVEKVGYDSAFTFEYSRRTGTPAALLPQVPEAELKDRFNRLLVRVREIGSEKAARYTGSLQKVLVEQVNEKDSSLVTGRMENNSLVHFPGDASMIGKIYPVRLAECKDFYYMGTLEEA